VSVLQSNYVPWVGYFNLIKLSDITVIYDSVQYTKNDWRNRNRIAGRGQVQWLTIPVSTAGKLHQPINEARVVDNRWAIKHWRTLQQSLGSATYFSRYRESWEELYSLASRMDLLHDINLLFIEWVLESLDVSTELVDDRILSGSSSSPTDRLVDICRELGADSYITGPAGLNYIETNRFSDASIALEVIDYEPIARLDSSFGIQTHLSILDTFSSIGEKTLDLLVGQPVKNS
jgi:hypothetical protein